MTALRILFWTAWAAVVACFAGSVPVGVNTQESQT